MKRRSIVFLLLAIAVVAAGCSDTSAAESAIVEELPIEEEAKIPENIGVEEVVSLKQEETQDEDTAVEAGNEKGTIVIGTTGVPFTEILTQAKIQMAKSGWNLQIKTYDDYQKLNEDVINGTLDAHLFAHQTYIDSYNDVNGTSLTAAAPICYEVYGIYSKTNHDLTNVSNDALIGVPAEDTKRARALLFMQDLGWIALKDDVGITAIPDDIVDNPKNLQFKEYEQDTLGQIMDEVEYCIVGADIAVAAGFDIEKELLQKETSHYESANAFTSLLIALEENIQSEQMKVLIDALKSEDMKKYMEDTYRGAYAVME